MKTEIIHPPAGLAAPDKTDSRLALEAVRLLSGLAPVSRKGRSVRLQASDKTAPAVEVPTSAFRLFLEILNQMAQGNAVTLVPSHHELTTQQAADLLRVSRPYFVKLIESGAIHYHRVGSRRRVKFENLMAYMEKVKGESREALDELAAQAQELGMGY